MTDDEQQPELDEHDPDWRHPITGCKKAGANGWSPKWPLERPWVRRALVKELALAQLLDVPTKQERGLTNVLLGKKYGVGNRTVQLFGRRHRAEIDAVVVAGDSDDAEFAGLWIAAKDNRLAMYQRDIERIEELLEEHEGQEHTGSADQKLMQTKHAALRAAAEELGQLPQRVSIAPEAGTKVRYEIEGVQLGDVQ